MLKIKVVSATLNKIDETRKDILAFTLDNLKQLRDTAIGTNVNINFDHEEIIGKVIGAEIVSNQLILELELDVKITDISNRYIVPGYIVSEITDSEMKTISSMCYGAVLNPIDEGVTLIDASILIDSLKND